MFDFPVDPPPHHHHQLPKPVKLEVLYSQTPRQVNNPGSTLGGGGGGLQNKSTPGPKSGLGTVSLVCY